MANDGHEWVKTKEQRKNAAKRKLKMDADKLGKIHKKAKEKKPVKDGDFILPRGIMGDRPRSAGIRREIDRAPAIDMPKAYRGTSYSHT